MKAFKITLVISLLYTGGLFANSTLHPNSGHKPNIENGVDKATPEVPSMIKMLFFNTSRFSQRLDTAKINRIKPDYEGILLPENKLWLRNKEN